MEMLRKCTIWILLLAFSSSSVGATGILVEKRLRNPLDGLQLAQAIQESSSEMEEKKEYTMAKGMLDGEMHASNISTGGKFATGLAVGVVTGLIGTGIGYFIVGPKDMDAMIVQAMSGKGEDYSLGFRTSWNKKTASKKKNAFLGGGLLGTAAFVTIYVSSR
jgi:hypothetical protein